MNVHPQSGSRRRRTLQASAPRRFARSTGRSSSSPSEASAMAARTCSRRPRIRPHPRAARARANWSTVVEELGAQASDLRIMKRQSGAFHGTELDLQLRRRGIHTIVLAAHLDNVKVRRVEPTRDAFERGYEQVFVGDAMASPRPKRTPTRSSSRFRASAGVRTTDEVRHRGREVSGHATAEDRGPRRLPGSRAGSRRLGAVSKRGRTSTVYTKPWRDEDELAESSHRSTSWCCCASAPPCRRALIARLPNLAWLR